MNVNGRNIPGFELKIVKQVSYKLLDSFFDPTFDLLFTAERSLHFLRRFIHETSFYHLTLLSLKTFRDFVNIFILFINSVKRTTNFIV